MRKIPNGVAAQAHPFALLLPGGACQVSGYSVLAASGQQIGRADEERLGLPYHRYFSK